MTNGQKITPPSVPDSTEGNDNEKERKYFKNGRYYNVKADIYNKISKQIELFHVQLNNCFN